MLKRKEIQRSEEISFEDLRKLIPFDKIIQSTHLATYWKLYEHMKEWVKDLDLSTKAFNLYTRRFRDEIYDNKFYPTEKKEIKNDDQVEDLQPID